MLLRKNIRVSHWGAGKKIRKAKAWFDVHMARGIKDVHICQEEEEEERNHRMQKAI